MRRTILFLAVVVLLGVIALPAGAIPKEPTGCRATESGWMLDNVKQAYAFHLSLASEAGYTALQVAATHGFTTVKELWSWYQSVFESTDSNGDGYLCVKRPQGADQAPLAAWMPWQAILLDNNANA